MQAALDHIARIEFASDFAHVDVLPGLLAHRPADALTVVFQTASTGYLEQERYDTLLASLDLIGVAIAKFWKRI